MGCKPLYQNFANIFCLQFLGFAVCSAHVLSRSGSRKSAVGPREFKTGWIAIGHKKTAPKGGCFVHRIREISKFLTRFGDDLLSHTLRCSTIGATVLNGQVRDGAGCFTRAMITKPRKKLGAMRFFVEKSCPSRIHRV